MAAEAAIDLKFSQCFGEKGAVDDLTDGESSVCEKDEKIVVGMRAEEKHEPSGASRHADTHVDHRSAFA